MSITISQYNSFDVFDTLIGRLCYKGTEIFSIMEYITHIVGFKKLRMECEMEGLDNIYGKMESLLPPCSYSIESLKKLELQLEYEFSFPITKYLNMLQNDDILVSDMYLSTAQIYTLLHKHRPITNKLYVSSGGKSSGAFWNNKEYTKHIALHTGDNYVSDYVNPTQARINAYWINNVDYSNIELIFESFLPMFSNMIRAVRLSTQHNTQPIATLFYETMLPVGILICIYIKKMIDINHIEKVVFLSRDGYWLYVLFQIIFPTIPSSYEYFSRIMCSNKTSLQNFITNINNTHQRTLIVDLVGSGTTFQQYVAPHLHNCYYLLCFPWKPINHTDNKTLMIDVYDHNHTINTCIEMLFSAPHGSAISMNELLSPEYDIDVLYPYIDGIRIFTSYYKTYTKYVPSMIEINNISHNNIISMISNIFNQSTKNGTYMKLSNHIQHVPNHTVHGKSYPLTYYSQIGQDKYYIEQISKFKINGVFLDIGGYDGITGSNTYFLEKHLGWNGIVVECNPIQFEKCKNNRKCILSNKAIYKYSNHHVNIVIPDGDEIQGGKQQLAGIQDTLKHESLEYFNNSYRISYTISVPTISINDILKENNITYIDYMSLDIEGYEVEALKSIDFNTYIFAYMTVEHGGIDKIKKEIYDILTIHGYQHVRTNQWDDEYMYRPLTIS